MRIYLIGFMGAGKTYIGNQLAKNLGFKFLDLDHLIEQVAETTVSMIFESKGETYFRDLEAKCLRKTADFEKIVIATGGGAPCFHENLEWMNHHGLTIYLKTGHRLLARRLRKEANKRPLLQNKSGEELTALVKNLLRAREDFYKSSHIWYEIVTNEQEILKELSIFLSRFTYETSA